MSLLCKDCRHIVLSKFGDPLMQLAECGLTSWEHPVNGVKRGTNCFEERITGGCGREGKNFAARLESVA